MGLEIVSFEGIGAPSRLDIAIDGADQVAPSGWVVKGGGGAHTREKAVAAAADRFVVIVSSDKIVGPARRRRSRSSSPSSGSPRTLARLEHVRLRDAPLSPDRGVIADYLAPFEDPEVLSAELSAAVGVVEHGLFPGSMVADVLVGRGDDVEHRVVS